jgi:KDO2-lipid IV(A) lauroyltransferase
MEEKKHQARLRSRRLTLIVGLVTALTWPLAWLPAPLGLAWGAAGGRLVFYLWARRRRIAVANIEMVKEAGSLPADLNARATAREVFANLGRGGWETICFYHRGLKPFEKYCQVEGEREKLEALLAESRREGRGLMLVTGHMGNWEIMSQYLARLFGFHFNVVGQKSGHDWLDALVERIRTRLGNDFIAKSGGARDMLMVLKRGGVMGTLIDQAAIGDSAGVSLPFLGREAVTNLGPVRLARHGRARIVLILFRRAGRRHYLTIFPPLEDKGPDGSQEGLLAEARQLNDWLGEHIQKYPDQWMWGHRRWKTRAGVHRDPDSLI